MTKVIEADIPTVLIIDDSPTNLGIVVECLELQGYRVLEAHDGVEGLQRASFVQPDIVLLDIMMPELDGFEVCRQLKAQADTQHIPVIFMTALVETEHKVNGFKAGAVDYVTKPIQADELVARVGAHLKFSAMKQQVDKQNLQLRKYHNELEELVAEHTAELTISNRQLRQEIDQRQQAQQLLIASEQQFRSLAENSPDNIARYDLQCRMIYINPRLEQTMGVKSQVLLDKTPMECFPDGRFADSQARTEEVIRTGQDNEIELTLPDTGEGLRYHHVRFVAERGQDGEVIGVLSMGRDITRRKRAEEALAAREREFRTLAENLPDNIIRYDMQARKTYVNPAIVGLMGDPATLLGRLPEETLPAVCESQFEEYAENLRRVLATGEPQELEMQVRHPVQGEQILNVSIIAERDEAGSIIGALMVSRDITERKHAYDAALRFQEIFENITDGVFVLEVERDEEEVPHFRFIEMNPAMVRMGKLYQGNVLGRYVEECVPEDAAQKMNANYRRCVEAGKPIHYEMALEYPSGIMNFDSSLIPMLDGKGRVHRIICVTRDITERKRAELERQAQTRSVECMNQVNKAIIKATVPEKMMSDVLDVVLAIFDCDRAFLLYPSDPDVVEWHVPMERTRTEYPGALALGTPIPMGNTVARMMRIMLDANGPVTFGPGAEYSILPDVSEQFSIKSMMAMAIHPQLDKPWQFGIHQCSHVKVWTEDETILFQKIGWRLSDALTSMVARCRLSDNEKKFRTLVENLPDVIVRYDRECRRIYVSPSWVRVNGLPAQDALGKTPEQHSTRVAPVSAEFQAMLRQVMLTGIADETEINWVDEVGDPVCYALRAVPESDDAGNITSVLTVAREVTEHKRAEEERLKHEQEFRVLVENSPDIIIRYDRECRRTYVNPAYMSLIGSTGAQALGKTPFEYFADNEHKEEYEALLNYVMGNATDGEMQLEHPVPDRGRAYYDICVVPEFDSEGIVRGALAIGRDVTFAKESELRLKESSDMLRELAARNESAREAERKRIAREIHDELGQMLNVMRLNVLVLNYQFGPETPALQDKTQTMLENLDRTIGIVRDIVSALRPSVLSAGIVAALDWLTQEFSKNTGIACNLWTEQELALDEAQVTAMFRIVQESLTNVVRHSGADMVEISLTLARNGEVYLLEIADNGKGFNPDQPRKQKSLGLVGMQERAIMLGGSISFSSTPQQGTVLQVYIPVNQVA